MNRPSSKWARIRLRRWRAVVMGQQDRQREAATERADRQAARAWEQRLVQLTTGRNRG